MLNNKSKSIYIGHILFFLIALVLSLRMVIDPDLWWQLAVGRHIWETGVIPQADMFSFSAPNYPYVYHTWLADIFLYLSYSRWGLWGVSIFYALIFGVGFWFMAKTVQKQSIQSDALNRKKRRFYKGTAFHNWLLLFFVPFIAWIVEARVQVFTFVGLTILYYLFSQKDRRKLRLVPLLFILWVNLHGGFLLGLGFLFLLVLMKAIETGKQQALQLTAVFTLSVFASLLNPYGHRALKQGFLIGTNTFNMQYNLDWAPLFNAVFPSLFSTTLIVGLFIYTLFLLVILSGKKTSWQEKILVILFFFLTLRTRKYMMALLVVLIPAVVVQLEYWWDKVSIDFRKQSAISNLPIYLSFFAALFVIFGHTVLVLWKTHRATKSEQFYASLPAPLFVYPYEAMRFMQKEGVPDRMFNDIAWGGYLIWHFPGHRFFIDGRMDNFYIDGKPFTVDYWQMINVKPAWQDLMDKYKINAVSGPPNWPIIDLLRDQLDWEVLYEDDVSILIKRSKNNDQN